jgi:hypothetical protein
MTIRLDDQQQRLVREVMLKYHPDLLPTMDAEGYLRLTDTQAHQLFRALSDEFCVTGLREDSEPNQRGLALEDLIDKVNVRGHRRSQRQN